MYDFQLGAGTSLPGLVAAKVGADVTLTDIAHNTEVKFIQRGAVFHSSRLILIIFFLCFINRS